MGPLPVVDGVAPTLVIVLGSSNCKDPTSKHTGVVFFAAEPVAWNCLTDAELGTFKAWGIASFSSVHILTVTSPVPQVNCPPPNTNSVQVDAIREELRRLAPQWFAQANVALAS